MKSRELIRQLQEIDPTGETEVCVSNYDIYYIDREVAYWDGRLEVLKRDEKNKISFNIVGAKITGRGEKIRLKFLSIEDLLLDSPELPVEFEDINQIHVDEVERWRQEGRNFLKET